MKLGKCFTLEELVFSQQATRKGIDNTPGKLEKERLRLLVVNVLDPLREAAGRPVVVSSGFRNKETNKLVGGSRTSQHLGGEAADITIPGMTIKQIVALVKKLNLPYDQMIDEWGSWVHLSYGPRNRRQFLLARTIDGATKYLPG